MLHQHGPLALTGSNHVAMTTSSNMHFPRLSLYAFAFIAAATTFSITGTLHEGVVSAATTHSMTHDQIYAHHGFVKNWIGGHDISFVPDPFQKAGRATGPIRPLKNVSSSSSTSSFTNAQADVNQVLQLVYPKGSYAPSIGPIAGGTHFYATPFGDKTSFSKMMISYEVAFPAGFNWALGGKLPGVYGGSAYGGCSGGVQATGQDCLTMRMMWRPSGIGEVYAYIPADAHSDFCKNAAVICNDQYGKSIGRGLIYFQPGTWTRLDMVMELNEPAGSTNGTLKVYQNGNLVMDMNNLPYRTSGMVGFQGLMFSSFFGGSDPSYATPVDTKVFFKNVQMSVGQPAVLYEGSGNAGSPTRPNQSIGSAFLLLCSYTLAILYHWGG
ncbi:hypothetical protein BG004_007598 [Podila humilis]|nr:hypothetical protein BG004_007598 [Podila humilis]